MGLEGVGQEGGSTVASHSTRRVRVQSTKWGWEVTIAGKRQHGYRKSQHDWKTGSVQVSKPRKVISLMDQLLLKVRGKGPGA